MKQRCLCPVRAVIKMATVGPFPTVRIYFILHPHEASLTKWLASLVMYHVICYGTSNSLRVPLDGICCLIVWNSLPTSIPSLWYFNASAYRYFTTKIKHGLPIIFQDIFHSKWLHNHYFLIGHLTMRLTCYNNMQQPYCLWNQLLGLKYSFTIISWTYWHS